MISDASRDPGPADPGPADPGPAAPPPFDELAELFERYAADTDPIYRPWLEEHVPAAGRRAADLGCGSGRFTGLLAGRYEHVLAVDVAERQIGLARDRHPYPGVDYQVRDLMAVDGRFDLVVSVNALHNLPDTAAALRHIKGLVAPGGHALLVDIVDPGQMASREWHIAYAFKDAEDSYRNRSRDHNAAADVLRLRLHPAWLDDVTSTVPLSRADFHAVYGEVFPGAEFSDDIHLVACGMRWTRTG